MLNIGKLAPGAAEYYIGEIATSAQDYYTGGGEAQGRWVGSLARSLALSGPVKPADFRAVLDGLHPGTGERLARSRSGCRLHGRSGANQASLFDHDAVDVPRAAARLRVSAGRVWQLLWAGERAAAAPSSPGRPRRYLVGTRVRRPDGRGDLWVVPRTELDRYQAEHATTKARPGYDLTLRPPKSVSVLWALGPESMRRAIRQAHSEAVDMVVDYVEQHALYARSGSGDRGRTETDGLVAAAFDHRTSRAGDPLLHTHVVVANLTRTVEGRWQAIDGRPLYEHARPAGLLYQAHLRHLLTKRLGLAWSPVRNGWAEVVGIPEAVIRAFSKRRDEIEAMVAESGYTSPGAYQAATLATRQAKDHDVVPATLETNWRTEADSLGFDAEAAAACANQPTQPDIDRDALFAHLAGPVGLTRQASTFERKEVVEALAEGSGAGASAAQIEQWADEFVASPLSVALETGRPGSDAVHGRGGTRRRSLDLVAFSTPELVATERRLLDWARDGFGGAVPGARDDRVERVIDARVGISDEQAAMVRAVCSPDVPAIQAVAGRPGAGKTQAAAACVEAFTASGVPVVGCALSATATAELEAATDLGGRTAQPARTIARLLGDLDRHGLAPGSVILVDEASMVGTRDLAALATHAARCGGALKLIGDPDQHGPVDAGGLFAGLAREGDESVIRLVANHRQRDPADRAAIDSFRRGGVTSALASFDERGHVVRSATAEASYDAMVTDWWDHARSESLDPMIAGPNRVRVALNHRARLRLAADGQLSGPAIEVGGRQFQAGDWVVTRRNASRLTSPGGHFVKNGSAGVVASVDAQARSMTVDFAKEGRITLPETYLAGGWVDHGYARTTYGVQGATLDRAMYHVGDQSSFEEGYVALTRGRNQTRIYLVDGTVAQDESGHRAHDPEPTGMDTVAEALERRRSRSMAHDADPAAAAGVHLARSTLGELHHERGRIEATLASAPPDPADELAAAQRRHDALGARRRAWTDLPRPTGRIGAGMLKRWRSGPKADGDREGEIARIDRAMADLDGRIEALTASRAERHQYLVANADVVARQQLMERAERSRELAVRIAAVRNPGDQMLRVLGPSPVDPLGRQTWRNAVETVAVHIERHGMTGDDRDNAVTELLGRRPGDAAARASYDEAMDALGAVQTLEAEPVAVPEPVMC